MINLDPSPIFKISNQGRSGYLDCNYNDVIFRIDFEISGSPKYHILLSPMDFTNNNKSKNYIIPVEIKHDILKHLRVWLKNNNIKSDIDLPNKIIQTKDICIHVGCNNNKINDTEYCLYHFNSTMLR